MFEKIVIGSLTGLIIALFTFVFSNEKGLKYSRDISFNNNEILLNIYKIGRSEDQKKDRFYISASLLDTSDYELKNLIIERKSLLTSQRLKVEDIEDQTRAKRKIEASLDHGFYRMKLRVHPTTNGFDKSNLVVEIQPSKKYSYDPKIVSPIAEILYWIFFNLFPLLIVLLIFAFVFFGKWILKKIKKPGTTDDKQNEK